MTLREVVKQITGVVGGDCPVYADDSVIYVCGADKAALSQIPDSVKRELKEMDYMVTAVSSSQIRKVGKKSHRLN